jgi:uncharacterized membrane protein
MHRQETSAPWWRRENVGTVERWISIAAGTGLILNAIQRRSPGAITGALAGAALLHRGATGTCMVYSAVGVSTADRQGEETTAIPYGRGIRVDRSITVNRPAAELYKFWRQVQNLPLFMQHLEKVEPIDDIRSRWVARGPAGSSIEWTAEIINEVENELIGWSSTADSQIANAGSVHFSQLPGDRGTEIRVVLRYDPPGGKLGAAFAKMFGEEPSMQIYDDLRRFKGLIETGEIATTQGQPSGDR